MIMFNKEQLQRFSIRKLTVGAASVLIGVSLMTEMSNNKVYADVRTTNENSNSQVHDNSDGNTLNLSTDLKNKADEAGTADSEVTNNSNAKVGGDSVTDNSNARNVEIKNIDDSKKDQQSGDAVAPKEKTANTIQKHEENVAKGTTVDSNDLQVAKAQADLAATKINGKASSVVSPQIKQIQAKYQISKNLPLEKQIYPTDENSDGKVVVKAEDPSNYPRDLNNLIGEDKYIYQVLSFDNDPDTKLILSVNRNDSTDKNIYAYVDNNGKIEPVTTVGENQKEIIDINKRGYQINNDGSSNIIIGVNKESTQGSSTVTSAPGYYTSEGGYYDFFGFYHPKYNIYHTYSNANPIEQGYGLGSTTSNDLSAIGEIIPIYTESSVIKYYYYDDNDDLQEFKDSDLSLHPNVVVTGLTGQEFKIPNVDQYKQVIPGFYLMSKDIPTNFAGTLSQFEEGKYYKKAYYNYDTDNVEYYSVYHQISPDGTMEVGVFDKNGNQIIVSDENGHQIIVSDENGHKRPKLVEIKAGHHITFEFQIQDQTHFLTVRNPYVTAAPHEVQFIYKKLGSIIPVDEHGKQIGNAIQFKNNLNDPTQALPGIVPSISGYHPKDRKVGATVDPDSEDPSKDIEVEYVKSSTISVVYHDNTSDKDLSVKETTGDEGTSFNYNPATDLATLKGKGYVLDGDLPKIPDKFPDEDKTVIIPLKHGTHKITDKQTVTETVTYKMSDGSKAPDKVEKQVEFSRDGYNDEVTKQDHWNKWQPGETQTFDVVPTPEVKGYTPDIKLVEAKTVTSGDKDITVTVTYNPDQQKAKVLFIDDTTKNTLDTHNLTGVTNGHESYNPSAEIDQFVDKHYVLVSSDYPEKGFTYDNDNSKDQVFEIHLKHGTHAISDKKAITETITYKMSDDSKAPDKVEKQVEFSRVGKHDDVTNTDTWNAWQPNTQSFSKVPTPEVKGYTPDIKSVEAKTVTAGDNDITVTVTYNPGQQKAKVLFIDDTAKKTLDTHNLTGVTNGHESYSPSTEINQFVNKHYVLVPSDYPANGFTYDNDDSKDQVFEVHLVHTYEPVETSQTITETVHYIDANGKPVAPDHVAKVVIKVTGTRDKVTDSIIWNTPSTGHFDEVISPEVPNMTPDKKLIPGRDVQYGDSDITESVVYTPDNSTSKTPEKPDKPSKEVSKIPEKPNKSSKEVSKAPEKSIDSRTVDNHVSAKSTAKRELPQTGATTNTGIWTGLVSMIASLGLLGASKKRKKN